MEFAQIKYLILFVITVVFTVMAKLWCPQLMFIPPVLFSIYVSRKFATLENIQKVIDLFRK